MSDILETARKRFARGIEVDSDNRDHALEMIKFRNLEQWDPGIKNQREKDPEGARPCLVVDKTNQYLRQVLNEERQNRPAIKVRPIDDKGDPEVAEVFQGIVRHIEDASGADLAYDTAYEQAVDGGFGYFRIISEYCDENSFDQDIRIKRIRNRFQVVLDPDRQQPDGSDAKWGFIVEKMSREDFKRQYPKADAMDFASDGKVFNDWVFKDYVLIAEYFTVETEKKTLCLWESGQTSIKDEAPKTMYPGDRIIKERETEIIRVKWRKISAKDVLEENDWPGKFIPIVEVIGNELDIEGKSVKSGLLKPAVEPQKIYNYSASSFVEGVALAPRAQWVAAEGQIEGYEQLYRTANRRNISVLPYKPVVMDGVGVPPPQRSQPAGISVGWQQTLQNAEHDIQASMGMYNASIGAPSNEKSGKAIIERKREGDMANFHYMDNLSRSIRHCGRILIDLIPKYYDTERVARILGEDGTTDSAPLNPNQETAVREVRDELGAIKKIYNLNVGKYDVAVTVGPAYTTKRQEAVDWMTQIVQASPDLMQIMGDIMFRNMDAPGADEISKRLKKMLPPPLQDDEEEAQPMVQTPQGPIPLDQASQMIAQMMQQVQEMGQQLEKGDQAKAEKDLVAEQNNSTELALKAEKDADDTEIKRGELQIRQQEIALEAERVEIERYNAETKRLELSVREKEAERRQDLEEFNALNPPEPAQPQSGAQ